MTLAKRLKAMGSPGYQNDGDPRTSGPGFALTLHPDRLDQPLRWTKPRRIFVNSMSDLFHVDVPDVFRLDIWQVMAAAPQHVYQILTKRPQAMARFCRRLSWVMPPETNVTTGEPYLGEDPITCTRFRGRVLDACEEPLDQVWLGTSIESDRYTFRADHLRATPAAVRFLSLEPLLGPLPSLDLTGIDWVIVGGESGQGARPMHPQWARDIRDRCNAAGVAFLFKQNGAWVNRNDGPPSPGEAIWMHTDGRTGTNWSAPSTEPGWEAMFRMGKHQAGRLLDGRTWDEYPGERHEGDR